MNRHEFTAIRRAARKARHSIQVTHNGRHYTAGRGGCDRLEPGTGWRFDPGLVRRTRYAGLTRARRRTYATNADRNELVACIFLGAAIVGIAGGAIAALLF